MSGGHLRIKLNNGTYTSMWFRYDMALTWNLYRGVHPEDLEKVRPRQLPVGHPHHIS